MPNVTRREQNILHEMDDLQSARDNIPWEDMSRHNFNRATYDQLTENLFSLRRQLDLAQLEDDDERISD